MLENTAPTLSVILPIYNGLPYLEEAINSVLSQSFRDFEFLIINDGSSDGSALIVDKFDDPRIHFFQQQNQGLAATLNRGIALAKGKYIARQDQDDVCFPQRFQKQIAFLDANPDVAMVGTSAEIWVGNERTHRVLAHPTDDASLKLGLLFDNYFVHSSIVIRRDVLKETGGYSEDKSRQPPEDYELWSRVIRAYKVANLPEVLMAYREVPNSMSRVGKSPFLRNLIKISTENIAWAADCAADSPEVTALSQLVHGDYELVPQGVKFSDMKMVLNQAMQRIAIESNVPLQYMAAISRSRINLLCYRYIDYCSGGLIGKALNSHIGRYIKSMLKRILMMVAH